MALRGRCAAPASARRARLAMCGGAPVVRWLRSVRHLATRRAQPLGRQASRAARPTSSRSSYFHTDSDQRSSRGKIAKGNKVGRKGAKDLFMRRGQVRSQIDRSSNKHASDFNTWKQSSRHGLPGPQPRGRVASAAPRDQLGPRRLVPRALLRLVWLAALFRRRRHRGDCVCSHVASCFALLRAASAGLRRAVPRRRTHSRPRQASAASAPP
jgi:hypothetical protein